MITPEELMQFGKVEICKEENRTFSIRITIGFKGDISTALKAINLISNHLAGKYTRIIKCEYKEDNFNLIAAK